MPRTDENGRQLKALLDYLLDGDVEAKNIYDALGVSSSTYYRRLKESDYPNAEELRLVADRFDLNYPDLQVRFGLMTRQEVWNYIESSPLMVQTIPDTTTSTVVAPTSTGIRHRLPRLSELSPRHDAPPL
ncbi:transcriptional regulator [Mycobacterium sp. MS1601]|uniref:transcriptional regulator n=1 Tax=Mycobacterium sp. MS1601 TaxID=1936029 RepID=UPI0009796A34|nr:transcriptional regulator [Mycobacterium sp. MS1601]AQA06797.1 transcriptional regulator [Mycobacterium sp. MS1601]